MHGYGTLGCSGVVEWREARTASGEDLWRQVLRRKRMTAVGSRGRREAEVEDKRRKDIFAIFLNQKNE